MGCCLWHPILSSGLLSTPWLVVRAGAILAWIQPTQHFGLSPAVTEPRLQLSMPEPRQMLGYVCLLWPSHHSFPGRWGSLWQRWLEEIPSPSPWRLLSASPGEARFEELGSASFPWKTLPGEAPALAQGPKTLAGCKSPQLVHGTEPLCAGDGTCPLSLLTAQQTSCSVSRTWACLKSPGPDPPAQLCNRHSQRRASKKDFPADGP